MRNHLLVLGPDYGSRRPCAQYYMRSDEHLTFFSYLPVSLCSPYFDDDDNDNNGDDDDNDDDR